MEWSTKRRILYILIALVIFSAIGLLIYYLYWYHAPSCTDGIKNQNEEDVDCGGVCSIACSKDVLKPIVLWQRTFESAPGMYNAVAYVENPNSDLGTETANYQFSLYDDQNIFITQRTGTTFLVPNERFAIFEARFAVGQRIPKNVFFNFTSFSPWKKVSESKTSLSVQGEQMSGESDKPRVDAVMQNPLFTPVKNINVTAVVYDGDDNAIGASATVVDSVAPQSSYNIVFTWFQPFRVPPVRVEIIPRINPFIAPAP